MKKVLRHGYTTGACAAATAKGAAIMLRDKIIINEVELDLPAGISAIFKLEGQQFTENSASCFTIKDAGDDPDITNGAEVHATVTIASKPLSGGKIRITGGTGIGKATKPGLAVAPGDYAINPVPRRMITEAVSDVFGIAGNGVFQRAACSLQPDTDMVHVTISIPDGELRATKTLNARLGILGGLSILGTTGIVRPVSAKAWTDTIDAALDVSKACNCETVVFSTGRTSEMAAQKLVSETKSHTPLPEEAYVMMGDHVAHALRSSMARGFSQPQIACQFAKLVKIACGYENTHAAASEMDLAKLLSWANEENLPTPLIHLIANANTAREIAVAADFDETLIRLTARHAIVAAQQHAPGINPTFMVADYKDRIVFDSSSS